MLTGFQISSAVGVTPTSTARHFTCEGVVVVVWTAKVSAEVSPTISWGVVPALKPSVIKVEAPGLEATVVGVEQKKWYSVPC